MFRFTIRDVLWLMAVTGLAVALLVERNQNAPLRHELSVSTEQAAKHERLFIRLATEWELQKPQTMRRKEDGAVTVKTAFGTTLTLRP